MTRLTSVCNDGKDVVLEVEHVAVIPPGSPQCLQLFNGVIKRFSIMLVSFYYSAPQPAVLELENS